MPPQNHKLIGIQYLRGIAAIMVALYHIGEYNRISFPIGAAGVDIFFIISGFVMWITTYNSKASSAHFLRKRLQRIAPLYWIVTFTTILAHYIKPNFIYTSGLFSTDVLQSLLFIPYFNASHHIWPTVLQGWTLNIEIFFYGLIALTLTLPSHKRLTALSAFVSAILLFRLTTAPQSAILIQWSDPMLLELLTGMFLGRLYTNGKLHNKPYGPWLLSAGIITFILRHIYGYGYDEWRTLSFGIPALAIVSGCLMTEINQTMPKIPALQFLGDASYSIYLWHNLILVTVGAAMLRLGPIHWLINPTAQITAVILVSLAAYQTIEKRIITTLKKRSAI